jgi:hypothetical protein
MLVALPSASEPISLGTRPSSGITTNHCVELPAFSGLAEFFSDASEIQAPSTGFSLRTKPLEIESNALDDWWPACIAATMHRNAAASTREDEFGLSLLRENHVRWVGSEMA